MVTSSQLARDIAASVLTHPSFLEPCILLRSTEGHRNQYGEFVEGATQETPISCPTVPITGQERLIVPEGLRNEDIRKFYVLGDVTGLHYGLADGDRFVLGQLGSGQNRFDGPTVMAAEQLRDQYAIANPTWFAGYQSSVTGVIQLRGFGDPLYQRYDAVDGHWVNADQYRAYRPQRWGAFTEVTAIRRDPGNL